MKRKEYRFYNVQKKKGSEGLKLKTNYSQKVFIGNLLFDVRAKVRTLEALRGNTRSIWLKWTPAWTNL